MKIFSASIQTETNTFSSVPTTKALFEETYLTRGGQDLSNPNFWGAPMVEFARLAKEHKYEYNESLCVAAEPAGIVPKHIYENYRDEILNDLKKHLPVDIVLLNLHGAMVAEGYDDCEGDIISKVREIAGDNTIIGVELDLHTHLTQLMIEKSDLLIAFKEYPHTDVAERANDLFHLAIACHQKKIKPYKAMFDCHMINLFPTYLSPMREIVKEIVQLEKRHSAILNISLLHGFPWGDVADMGLKVLVTTDRNIDMDGKIARQYATMIGEKIYQQREATKLDLITLPRAIAAIQQKTNFPIVLGDFSDNPGIGGMGDSTFIAEALFLAGVTNVAIGSIYDPDAVNFFNRLPVGSQSLYTIGGKFGITSGEPLRYEWTLKNKISNLTQMFSDCCLNLGKAVVLTANGIDIIVNDIRSQTYSPDVFFNSGIQPNEKKVLVVKSSEHFRATFAKISSNILRVITPAAGNMDFAKVPYKKLVRPMWPIVSDPLNLC